MQAQKRFELGVSLNAGMYFPEEKELGCNIDKGLQADFGLCANYFVTKTTKLGTGVLYNYVKTLNTTFYSPEPTIPTLHAIEIPFYVQQQFYDNWFAEAGVSSLFHTETIETTDGNICTLGRWNLGGGIKLKKLTVSIQYSQNFSSKTIIIKSKQSSFEYNCKCFAETDECKVILRESGSYKFVDGHQKDFARGKRQEKIYHRGSKFF